AGEHRLGTTIERPPELIEMIVVVPRHRGEKFVERPAPARIEVNPAARPRLVRERSEERQRFVAPSTERLERGPRIVPKILPLFRLSVGTVARKARLRHRDDPSTPREKPLLA